MTHHDFSLSRRAFLAGSGLVIGFAVMPKAFAGATQGVPAGVPLTFCHSTPSSRSARTIR